MPAQTESTTIGTEEMRFLEGLRPRYEQGGYQFLVNPDTSILPAFFSSYRPDAIAIKDGKKIAIEIKSRSTEASRNSIERIRKLLSDHPEWELLVAYVGSEFSQSSRLPAPAVSDVAGRISEVRELARTHPRAAFLVAWRLLEAALNAVMPDADKRPRRPGTVVEALAMDGYISSETEASLRSLVDVRNRVVHGDLNVEPSEMDVAKVLDAVISTLDTH